MSHVTVSLVLGDKGKGVTCYGLWNFDLHCFKSGFGGKGKGITCNGFSGLGCERTKVSHVTGSPVLGEKGKGVTCYGLRNFALHCFKLLRLALLCIALHCFALLALLCFVFHCCA